jgi:hypothetical protein
MGALATSRRAKNQVRLLTLVPQTDERFRSPAAAAGETLNSEKP